MRACADFNGLQNEGTFTVGLKLEHIEFELGDNPVLMASSENGTLVKVYDTEVKHGGEGPVAWCRVVRVYKTRHGGFYADIELVEWVEE